MKKIIFSCFVSLISSAIWADVRLPHLFGDHMVLQRDRPIPVWGWAAPKEKITVQFNQQTKTVRADKTGKWTLKLDNETAGGPYVLTIRGKNTLQLNDVYVGEVWVCSGQSNMEMPIAGWGKIDNYQAEIAAADFPMIRHIEIPHTVSSTPQEDISPASWEVCSSATAGKFTAAGYFFARELFRHLKIPVGLIHTSWGGTMIETWISREAFENSDEFKAMIADMPVIDLDSLQKVKEAAMRKKIEARQGALNAADAGIWMDDNLDDTQWAQMLLPGLWDAKEYPGLDGVVWFRTRVTVPAADAGKPAILALAMIDDNDVTYVNGSKVGSTSGYNIPRNYAIPAGILKAGENSIAVRVEDTGGDGGIYGEGQSLSLTIGNNKIPLAGMWRYRVEKITGIPVSVGPNSYPTLLFNAMLNALIPYAMRGVIWYQGESNAGRARQYAKAFPLMINDWRNRWNEGDFPFYFVQLATFNAGNGDSKKGSTWAELRESQARTLSLPNTGMIVTTDIGNPADIHPKNKQDVGKRLAAIALHNVYGESNEYSGPMYASMTTEGNKVRISFTHTGSGLIVKDKYGYIKGFEISGTDRIFHYAQAAIDGNTVVVYADDVTSPVAVRYGWSDDAGEDNLFNREGFPAAPFRTDDWPGITEKTKYTISR